MFVKNAINWIFSDKCLSCSKEVPNGGLFCNDCFSEIIFIDNPFCQKCGKILQTSYSSEQLCRLCSSEGRFFDLGRSLFVYNDQGRKIVMRIKKDADEHIAEKTVKLLLQRYPDILVDIDYIVSVPSHFSRVLTRGFNPASVIAERLAKFSKVPLKNNLLKRIKKTGYQKNKTIAERRANVHNAFKVKEKANISGKNILLVDDVITTGATLSECSKALKEKGARLVKFLTIASTPG